MRALEWDKPGSHFNFVTHGWVSLDNLLTFSEPHPSHLTVGDKNIYLSEWFKELNDFMCARGKCLLYAAIVTHVLNFATQEK